MNKLVLSHTEFKRDFDCGIPLYTASFTKTQLAAALSISNLKLVSGEFYNIEIEGKKKSHTWHMPLYGDANVGYYFYISDGEYTFLINLDNV